MIHELSMPNPHLHPFFRYLKIDITRVRVGDLHYTSLIGCRILDRQGVDLARAPGVVISSSGDLEPTHSCLKAFDGRLDTLWHSSSAREASKWLAIDLGAELEIASVEFYPNSKINGLEHTPADFTVQGARGADKKAHVISSYISYPWVFDRYNTVYTS